MKLSQTEYERFILEKFLEDFDGVTQIMAQPDHPDAIVEIDGDRIAIEITGYVSSEERMVDDDRHSSLVDVFNELWGTSPDISSINLFVKFRHLYGRPCLPKPQKSQDVVNGLANLVRDHISDFHPHDPNHELDIKVDDERLNEYVTSVTLRRTPQARVFGFGSNCTGGWVALNKNVLVGLIDRKLAKVESYRQSLASHGATKLWLLVHFDGHPLATVLIDEQRAEVLRIAKERNAEASSRFDQLHIIDRPGNVAGPWVKRAYP
ncbi:MAG: hypothetical protein ACJAZ8_000892 [Planctomycetota bacterium]